VSTRPEHLREVLSEAADARVPAREIGTAGGAALAIEGVPDLPLAALRTAWEGTLPALFG
jgi:phosphoribosylformylglycinamidine synthase subunit PurL